MDELSGYTVLPADEAAVEAIASGCGLLPLTARVLVSRGIDTPERARVFLSPSLERDCHDPAVVPGLSEVADKVQSVMEAGGRILVFGDFDVDGISATALAVRGLRMLGARADGLIPHRYDEGYALSEAAVRRGVEAFHPDLVVTVDCGIACDAEVAAMLDAGLDVCITDHHEAGAHVPRGVPVADSKLDRACPSFDLAGAGVALKLVAMLGQRLGRPGLWHELVDLAALGTVSDIMPLTSENRAIVAAGLERMRTAPRPGIAALAAVSKTDLPSVTATRLSFSLIPRMNAAGRMGDATLAFDLLMSDDMCGAQGLAARLDEVNTQRKAAEACLLEQVQSALAQDPALTEEPVIIVAGEGWHEGVKGIVASRLAREYKKPTIIFTIEGGSARGSGRTYGELNLFELASSAQDLYERFGGHVAAIGLTLPAEKLPELRRRLAAQCAGMGRAGAAPAPAVDAQVRLSDCTLAAFEELTRLEPFGNINRSPLFALPHVFLEHRSAIGKTGTHFRYEAADGLSRVTGIYFNAPDLEALVNCRSMCDIVFEPQIDEWQGRKTAKLMTRKMLVSGLPDAPSVQSPLDARMRELLDMPDGGADGGGEGAGRGVVAGEDAPDAVRVGGPAAFSDGEKGEGGEEGSYALRAKWAALPADALDDALREELVGGCALHDAQSRALESLAARQSTLAVMATGRGKSLVFHLHAARLALTRGAASVFVYPLRALVADQIHHLKDSYARFGLEVRLLTGETPQTVRREVYAGLAAGEVDVVLTTPEYLCLHADELAASSRIGFLVVDEAHHIGMSRAGNRPAYAELGQAAKRLGDPCVLAATATAPDAAAQAICSSLSISKLVVDASVRANLRLDDRRDLANREDYLACIVATKAKCVAYVNSRDAAQSLARMLRHRLPALAPRVAFYHAGLSKADRATIEQAFRAGELSCIVATSAFGEGIDIPDIEHVVLFHMPFSDIEFNQMSGRAGRDGREAWVHLLYGYADARINERILEALAPSRDTMARLYRALAAAAQKAREDGCAEFRVSDAQLAEGAGKAAPESAATALSVFAELGFLQVEGDAHERVVRMADNPAHAQLSASVRYREGIGQVEEFSAFRTWALSADEQTLLARFTHPILPQMPESDAAPAAPDAAPGASDASSTSTAPGTPGTPDVAPAAPDAAPGASGTFSAPGTPGI